MSDPQILKRQLILQHIMSDEVYAQYLDALNVLLVDNMAPAIYLMFLEEDKEKTNKKWRVLLQSSYHKLRVKNILDSLKDVLHAAGMDVYKGDSQKLLDAVKHTLDKDVQTLLTHQGLSLDLATKILHKNEQKRVTWDLIISKFFPKHKSPSKSKTHVRKSPSKSKTHVRKSPSKSKTKKLKRKECQPGKYRSRTTHRCKKDKRKPCQSGWVRNPSTNRCRKQK